MNDSSIGGFFPLLAIRTLLFRDDRLEGIKPVSKGPGDTAKVEIIPTALGRYLAQLDPTEDYFHIEFLLNSSKDWAEVWLPFEWKESNARRSRRMAESAIEREEAHKTASRMNELVACMPAQFGEAYNNHVASLMLKGVKDGSIEQVKHLLRILNVAEHLDRYMKEDKGT